ncbi:MAG: hypothetical protein M3290_05175 [Actinomycetota bacterium]|nr:hypothetical protein [Actinomycetota bacterium]
MTRLRALCAFVVFAATMIVPVAAGPACASGPHAGLVVYTGSRVLRYCVALPAASVSGAKLIELAGDQYGLDYHFGSGGGAVCRLAGVGPDGDDCFADYPHYWGYWRGTSSGGWTWSSTGAASTSVSDGDVDGWAWGTGDDGSTHPQPPRSTFASVCASAMPQKSRPPRSAAPRSSTRVAPSTSPAPAVSPTTMQPAPQRHPRRHRTHEQRRHRLLRRSASAPAVTLEPSPIAAPGDDRPHGPPLTAIGAIAALCALIVVGSLTARSGRARSRER